MRAWERAPVARLCGGCGRQLEPGDPIFVFTIRDHRKIRCDRCEGPAPPDLPPLVARTNAITPRPLAKFHPVLPLGTPLADFRARQAGERDPGEEG